MHNTRNAHVAGLAEPDWPANDQAPGVMADGFRDQAQEDGADSHGASIAEQAAWTAGHPGPPWCCRPRPSTLLATRYRVRLTRLAGGIGLAFMFAPGHG